MFSPRHSLRCTCIAAVCGPALAWAQTDYLFPLTPPDGAATEAYGVARVQVSDGTNLAYFAEFTALSSNLTSLAFYNGATLEHAIASLTNRVAGAFALSPAQASALSAGQWRFVVGSQAYSAGELTGPVAATLDPNHNQVFEIALTPADVVPPSAAAGSQAFGTVRIVQTQLTNIAYHCEFFGIQGESPTNKVLHVYFRRGARGKTGPTIINTTHYAAAPHATFQTRHDTVPDDDPGLLSPIINTNRVSLLDGAQLVAGLWHAQIKTTKYLLGAARGQIEPASALTGSNHFAFALSPWQCVPAAARSAAIGSATVTLVDGTNFRCTVEYSGLLDGGPLTAAPFHKGAARENGHHGLDLPDDALASPITFAGTVSHIDALQIRAGVWYLNLHTAAYPNGELRGQLSNATFPGTPRFASDFGGDGFTDLLLYGPHEESTTEKGRAGGGGHHHHGGATEHVLQVLHLNNGVPFPEDATAATARHGDLGHNLRILEHRQDVVGANEFTYDDDPDVVIAEKRSALVLHGTNLAGAPHRTIDVPRRSKFVGTAQVRGNVLGEILFTTRKVVHAIDLAHNPPLLVAIYTNQARGERVVGAGFFHGTDHADLLIESRKSLRAQSLSDPNQSTDLGSLARGYRVAAIGQFKTNGPVTVVSARRNVSRMGLPGDNFYLAEKGFTIVGPR